MTLHRLTQAHDAGEVLLPETGRIAWLFAQAGMAVEGLAQDRVHVIQGNYPDHAAFAAAGYDVGVALEGPYAAALMQLPRSKVAARMHLAQAVAALSPSGVMIVDGPKTDGIDSLLRDVGRRLGTAPQRFSKAHGKLFWFAVPETGVFADWAEVSVTAPEGFQTVPGIFSAEKVDAGSALLAAHLPQRLKGRVADLGAGWGYLARAVLTRDGVETLDLVEASHDALGAARVNVVDPRAVFHWADATDFEGRDYDHVVMNPPFHQGRATDVGLGQRFITAAAEILRPKGTLWMVANRQLPYERVLEATFQRLSVLAETSGFKVISASHPRKGR